MPRRFTQEVSRLIYEWHEEHGGCAGIRYRSRPPQTVRSIGPHPLPVGTGASGEASPLGETSMDGGPGLAGV